MVAANWIALLAVFAGIGASIFTVWLTGKREGEREQQRRGDELEREERARLDRRREHWLDTKRDAYVQFLDAARAAADQFDRIATTTPRGTAKDNYVRSREAWEIRRQIFDRTEELALLAPSEIVELAQANARALDHAFAAADKGADATWLFMEAADGQRDEGLLREAKANIDDAWADVHLTRQVLHSAMAADLRLALTP